MGRVILDFCCKNAGWFARTIYRLPIIGI